MSNGGSSPACSRRYVFTQLPRVPSFRPSSRATCAIGRELSITNFTASSRYSGENFLRLDDIMPLYLTDGIIVVPVREPRGPSRPPPPEHPSTSCGRAAAALTPNANASTTPCAWPPTTPNPPSPACSPPTTPVPTTKPAACCARSSTPPPTCTSQASNSTCASTPVS